MDASPPPSSSEYSRSSTIRSHDSLECKSESSTVHERELSFVRILFIHIGAALTLFLATTDANIVSTCLPTIAEDLQATPAQYTWVAVAYLLTQTAFQPLYGRISDLLGRKNLLYASMGIFVVGSLLCGFSQNIVMLIASRALAGLGGGGIVSCVWVITAEVVDESRRALWSQALSVTWSCSAIGGPLLGGVFSNASSSALSWRWAFFINPPICLIAVVVLILSLRGTATQRRDESWKNFVQTADILGLCLFMAGTTCIIVGFSFATQWGWTSPSILILLAVGLIILVIGGIYETRTTREPIFPPTTFSDITIVIILVITFLHNFAFNSGTFYLAVYFQAINGNNPFDSGIRMFPFSLGASVSSIPAAWFINRWQRNRHNTIGQRMVISAGLALSSLGFGLLILLNEIPSLPSQIIYPLLAGTGIGLLMHAPYQVFGKALKPKELATGTSAFFLVRFTGATVGLTVSGAVFDGRTTSQLPAAFKAQMSSGSAADFSVLHSIEPLSLRAEVLKVYASSLQCVWIVCAPCLFLAFLISLRLKTFTIEKSISTKANEMAEEQVVPV